MSSDASDTDKLLQLMHSGDEQALARLFSRYREKLRKMVLFRLDPRLSGRVDSSDVLQEVYLDAAKRLHHYRESPAVSLLVWLRQITEQRLIDLHRRHFSASKRDARREAGAAGHRGAGIGEGNRDTGYRDAGYRDDESRSAAACLMSRLSERQGSPSEQAMRREFADAIQAALDELDPIDREVLALRHFEELTNNEVAEVLSLSKTAASNRYIRALDRLRRVLENVPGFSEDSS